MAQYVAAQTGTLKAKQPAAQPGRSGANSAAGAAAPANTTSRRPTDDSAARNDILQSRSWQDTLQQFNDWLSTQVLYDADEVKHIRVRLATGIDRMSAAQLEVFLNDLRVKMSILTSDRALDVQDYLSEKFLVASEAYTRRIRQQLPDVLSMTPAQIEQRLAQLAARRRSKAQLQGSFEQSREQRLAANSAQLRAREQQRAQAASRTTAAVTAASTPNNFTPSRDYFPDIGNNSPQIVIGAGFY